MNEAARPDYVKCIKHTHANMKNSWCNRRLFAEFAFVDIDHAAYNALSKGRLVACPECVSAIIKVLTNGL